jgi:hypothetical protein
MSSARELGGVIGAIIWIMISDVAGGIAGLAVGWLAMSSLEPLLGGLAACAVLVTVPLGLCAGGLLGVASLGWLATLSLGDSRPAVTA